MKRYYLLFISILIYSSCAWAYHPAFVGVIGRQGASAGGDSCTGNLLYSHHAENNDSATTSANGTQGCAATGFTAGWSKVGSTTYDNTSGYYGDGAYSLKTDAYNEKASVSTTVNLTEKGSISMWFRGDGAHDGYPFEIKVGASNFILATFYYSTNIIRLSVSDGSLKYKNSTATLPATGGWVQVGWDASTDLMQVRICDDAACSGESWETKTDTSFVGIGTMPATIAINGKDGSTAYGWVDNVKIYSSSDCTQ